MRQTLVGFLAIMVKEELKKIVQEAVKGAS